MRDEMSELQSEMAHLKPEMEEAINRGIGAKPGRRLNARLRTLKDEPGTSNGRCAMCNGNYGITGVKLKGSSRQI